MTHPHRRTLLIAAMLLAATAASRMYAQSSQPGPPTLSAPRLDSVSVQPSASTHDGFSAHRLSTVASGISQSKDTGVVVTNISVAEMLGIANNLPAAQIIAASDSPDDDWIHAAQFDLTAQGANLYMPTEHRDVLRLIVQSALANHFHVQTSHQSRELPGLALVAASDSSSPRKFHQPGPGPEDIIRQQITLLNSNLKMINGSTYELAQQLSSLLARPIVDQTGLTGLEDFTIQLTPPLGHSDNRVFPDPFLTAALKDQLGLELKPQTSPTPVLVVGHIDRAANEAPRAGLASR